jgi:hypothetical protein
MGKKRKNNFSVNHFLENKKFSQKTPRKVVDEIKKKFEKGNKKEKNFFLKNKSFFLTPQGVFFFSKTFTGGKKGKIFP